MKKILLSMAFTSFCLTAQAVEVIDAVCWKLDGQIQFKYQAGLTDVLKYKNFNISASDYQIGEWRTIQKPINSTIGHGTLTYKLSMYQEAPDLSEIISFDISTSNGTLLWRARCTNNYDPINS